ncbi:hypothetical protein L1085_016215 [Streptomyces sp. MSC1_001]|uniref:hypothetical protein n=1 Tax=Streptomyces sp. MSC1_001 TaxID=2909263 RepID=UPI00202FC15A|nr:hypothetical protein [Streptomyces sp. MSC1_001]
MTARTMALRLGRAQRRAERRDTLLGLLARLDTLTAAEQALLIEYVHAELTASDELRRAVQGQQRALQAVIDQTRAAEATIIEVEQERDAARVELAAARACTPPRWKSSLPVPTWPEQRHTFNVTGSFCATCRAWIPGPPGQPQTCHNPPAADQHPTTTKET